ncbi:MAG: hypothetical protein Q8M65_06960, partial [Rhodoglobus sp.]|nr:hypothetical protein [Rhodoglobus sp.]
MDTAWPSGFDINNDGYQDIFTPDSDVTSDTLFLLFLGGPAGPGPTPNGRFSDWIGVAGDIDGDGFGDVTVGESLYFGSPAGISTSPAAAMPTPYWFPVGDNNNDGYGDIMIYPPRPYRNSRMVSLVPGGPRGLLGDLGVPVTWIGDHKRYQTWGATAGDLNGDRREDAIVRVGTPGKTGDEPGIEIVRSRGTSWETARRLVCGGWPTQSTVAVGDVNGDGYADLWAKCYGARPYFAAGGPSGSPTIRTPSAPALYVYPIGDVNGDGCSDLIMSDDSTSTIHYGVAGANVATTAGRSVGRQHLRPVYDVNGDGYDDLLEYSRS